MPFFGRPAPFLHQGNVLVVNPQFQSVRVRQVFIPSPREGEEPFQARNSLQTLSPAAALEFIGLLLGDRDEGQVREALRAADSTFDAFYADQVSRLEYEGGAYQFTTFDEQGEAQLNQGEIDPMAPDFDYYGEILANDPQQLPFSNYFLNEGSDERCVDRWMGEDLDDVPWARYGWDAISKAARQRSVPHRIVDLLGGVMAEWIPSAAKVEDIRYGLVYNGHMYELMDAKPRLIRGPVGEYEGFSTSIKPVLERERAIKYCKNDTYYVGGVGVFRRKSEFEWEPWMGDLMALLPTCRGWDPHTMGVVARSARALAYACGSVKDDDSPDDYLALDVSKCYYRALLETVQHPWSTGQAGRQVIVEVGDPTMWDVWKPVEPLTHASDVQRAGYVEVAEDLSRWGILTNVIQGRMAHLLEANGVKVTPVRVLNFRFVNPWINDVKLKKPEQKKALELLEGLEPAQQKKYALVNGVMGKLHLQDELLFELHPDRVDEKLWYKRKYPGIQEVGNSLRLLTDAGGYINRLHWHAHVIHYASYLVLHRAFEVKRALAASPVRIKTDMLMYRRQDLKTPWDRDGKDRLWEVFERDPKNAWHFEPVQVRLAQRPPAWQRIAVEPPAESAYKNITYTGPPGTGKTHKVLHDHHFDYAVCFSNMGTRRLARVAGEDRCRTVHSLFQLWGAGANREAVLEDLRGLTVFVDEAQACGSALWSFFREAYHKVDARFIFAMDPDQIRPVREEGYGYDMAHPFLGTVHRMTHDYRNDDLIRHHRQLILGGNPFRGGPYKEMSPETFFEVNMAWKRVTRDQVNAKVARYLGMVWHQSGRYRVKEALRRLGLVKQQRLTCMGRSGSLDAAVYRDEDTGQCYQLTAREANKLLRWGYCTTIHAMVGETIEAPTRVGIWDWENRKFSKHLRYTALTRVQKWGQLRLFVWPRLVAPAPAQASPPPARPPPLTMTSLSRLADPSR